MKATDRAVNKFLESNINRLKLPTSAVSVARYFGFDDSQYERGVYSGNTCGLFARIRKKFDSEDFQSLEVRIVLSDGQPEPNSKDLLYIFFAALGLDSAKDEWVNEVTKTILHLNDGHIYSISSSSLALILRGSLDSCWVCAERC